MAAKEIMVGAPTMALMMPYRISFVYTDFLFLGCCGGSVSASSIPSPSVCSGSPVQHASLLEGMLYSSERY